MVKTQASCDGGPRSPAPTRPTHRELREGQFRAHPRRHSEPTLHEAHLVHAHLRRRAATMHRLRTSLKRSELAATRAAMHSRSSLRSAPAPSAPAPSPQARGS